MNLTVSLVAAAVKAITGVFELKKDLISAKLPYTEQNAETSPLLAPL